MRNTGLDEAQAGIKIVRRNINNLRYTEDTTDMAESEVHGIDENGKACYIDPTAEYITIMTVIQTTCAHQILFFRDLDNARSTVTS